MKAPAGAGHAEYLSAKETIQLLDIKLQTLYAYVSRGLIRSSSQPGKKARMYLRADVERVHARALARAGHGAVAADAMNHGQAIIPTSITEITPQGPSYRGRLATELARRAVPFESVAQLLWAGEWNEAAAAWTVPAPAADFVAKVDAMGDAPQRHPLLEVLALAVLELGLHRRARRALEEDLYPEARQIIAVLAGCCGLAAPPHRFVPLKRGERIAQGLLRALGGEVSEQNVATVNVLLSMLADHELSPGTLAVRVAASGGATLHGCIAAGVCASSGLNVAHVFDDSFDLLASASSTRGLLGQALRRHQAGRNIPGFGHPLYPQGDPRGTMLMDFIRRERPTRALLAVCDFIEEAQRQTGVHVRHELPMVALTRAMGLGKPAASAIFLVSRVAGWVAHIQEQREAGQLMRPRAHFVAKAGAGTPDGELNNQS